MDLTTLTEGELHAFLETIVAEDFPESGIPYSAEEADSRLARVMYERCLRGGDRNLVLSRVFQSIRCTDLPEELLDLVRPPDGSDPTPDCRVLALLGTWGDEEAWQNRRKSATRRAIPLDKEVVHHIPMLSRAMQQIGVDLNIFMGPESEKGLTVTSFGEQVSAFHVEKAPGSPYVPAQEEFVDRYSVQSVIGSAARLRGRDISLFIGFSRHRIPASAARHFSPMMVLFWQRLLPLVDRTFS